MKRILSIVTCIMLIFTFMSVNAKVDKNKLSLDEFVVELNNEITELSKTTIDTKGVNLTKESSILDKANILHLKVEEYLKESDPEVLAKKSDKLKELADKLDSLDAKVNEETRSFKKSSGSTWRSGDILIYGAGNNNAIGEPSLTGHTAVMSNTDLYVIEASKTRSNGAKVYHWDRAYLWEGCSGVKQYKVTSWLGTEASYSEKQKAITFGLNQVGDPYALQTFIWTNDKWYCSKLTYRQWQEAGYDLSSYWSQYVGYQIIIPDAIRLDANTRLYKDWGSSAPGYTN